MQQVQARRLRPQGARRRRQQAAVRRRAQEAQRPSLCSVCSSHRALIVLVLAILCLALLETLALQQASAQKLALAAPD